MKLLRAISYIITGEPYKGTNEKRKYIYCISKRTQFYKEVFIYLRGLKRTSTRTSSILREFFITQHLDLEAGNWIIEDNKILLKWLL